jgi:hypothetical protein
LAPTLLVKDEIALFVHSKEQWDNITVGFNGNQVRFGLCKKKFEIDDYIAAESKNQLIFIHEVPDNYKIVEKVDTSEYKGVALKLTELTTEKNDAWNMT